MGDHFDTKKLSAAGFLISLGIIFGDIGTSPLYVMKAVIGKESINEALIYGGVSAVFWTLTLMTSLKYVLIILRADNNGEGGIFSLYNLVKRQKKWLIVPAIIGGSTLLSEGMITPPLSISSAIEGLEPKFPTIPTIPITVAILCVLFFFQRYGTSVVGKLFGPVMAVWFTMLGVLGAIQIGQYPGVLKALNPMYAIDLIRYGTQGVWVLGAVFLCTTGAEALYSDLGHCGRKNIQTSWIFVKISLLLNYFGQAAWLHNHLGEGLGDINPFFAIMPSWFLYAGIFISTAAAIIASQALISGSFTLISEAIRLGFYPKISLNYPSNVKGQLYIPSINTILFIGCLAVVFYFKRSSNMEAAYGLSVCATMMCSTILLTHYLLRKRVHIILILAFLSFFILLESTFLISNLAKFLHGGYFTMILAISIITLMYIMIRAKSIKSRYVQHVKISDYTNQLVALSNDHSVPKYSTHLVFLSNSRQGDSIEQKVMYSILQKQPKRADIYWFVHIDVTDEPFTMEYKVQTLAKEDVIKITFKLGFRVQQRINVFMRKVVEDMVHGKEIDITSRYHSLKERQVTGDFRFVIIEETIGADHELPLFEQFILNSYITIKNISAAPAKWFGLDTSATVIEQVPLLIHPVTGIKLKRIE
jgi:KUP system potassium uptake protein